MSSGLLQAWNRTFTAEPKAVAVIDAATGRRWLRADIEQVALEWSRMHGATVAHQTVALVETNGAQWLRGFLGLLKCDSVIVPLDAGEPLAAQQATARAAGAAWLWRAGQLESIGPQRRRAHDGRRLIKLTSGSTGAPRSLLFTDNQLITDGRQLCAVMQIAPDDLNLGLIPWGHSYGLGNLVAPLLMQGTAIVYGAAPLPHAMAAAVVTWRPTIFPAVPALLRALAESTISPGELASLRTVISAGAPLTPEIAQAFHAKFEKKIHSFYGSSETGGISYDTTGDSAELGRGVGRPIPGVQIEFGRGGRFTVRSDAVFTLRNRRQGAHRMADIGRLNLDGELVLLGRAGRFVKIAGRRLNLAEVEHALKQLPGVKDAWVAPHAERADALAAAVATDLSGVEIREALRARLASWKIPKKILPLTEFPLTPRGKTDARRLRFLLGPPSIAG